MGEHCNTTEPVKSTWAVFSSSESLVGDHTESVKLRLANWAFDARGAQVSWSISNASKPLARNRHLRFHDRKFASKSTPLMICRHSFTPACVRRPLRWQACAHHSWEPSEPRVGSRRLSTAPWWNSHPSDSGPKKK